MPNPRDYYAPLFDPGVGAFLIQRSDGQLDEDDAGYYWVENDCWEAIDDKSMICPACNGCGEGRYDGSTCMTCKGEGEYFNPNWGDE